MMASLAKRLAVWLQHVDGSMLSEQHIAELEALGRMTPTLRQLTVDHLERKLDRELVAAESA